MATLTNYLKSKGALPCVYFSFSRRRCEDLAEEVLHADFLTDQERRRIEDIFSELTESFNLTHDTHINYLRPLIRRGIAYHHAGLLPTLKEIIERLFTTGLIKLIFTTETFALGINMPARTVAFDALTKYYGRFHRHLKTRDFYQMAGRAGRRGIDEEGFVFVKVNPHRIGLDTLGRIIYGQYEPIRSQLRSCYATIINLYRLMGDRIYDIYPRSFHFFQNSPFLKKEAVGLLRRKVTLLKDLGYIDNAEITWKADLASKVYSFELQVGELFEKGFLDDLDEESLFIVISSLVYEPRKGEHRPKLPKRVKRIKKDLDRFMRHIHRIERRFRIYPLSKKFYFHMAEASRAWFEGADFYKLNKFCSVDEGEIVRYLRMSIQVLREMNSSGIINDEFKHKLSTCIKRINRDVVDAERQLRQDL